MAHRHTNLHVLWNVPSELVDSETALRCLLTTNEVDISFLHELDGFRLDKIIRFVKCELGGDTRRTLSTRLIVTDVTE